MMLLPLSREPKLVPPKPCTFVLLSPCRTCHWMPNSARRSAATSTISASTNTCARRTSSRSMIARKLLYSGSGPMMISALLATSAWIMSPPGSMPPAPPVLAPRNGLAADAGAAVACWPAAGVDVPSWLPIIDGAAAGAGVSLPPPISDRSVCATRVASALRKYTMNMLPPGRPACRAARSAPSRAPRAPGCPSAASRCWSADRRPA